jgi:hypothetical protein
MEGCRCQLAVGLSGGGREAFVFMNREAGHTSGKATACDAD